MLVKDTHGIIVQHNADYPSQSDGGDSARTNGLVVLYGDKDSAKLRPLFIIDKKIVRHPYQKFVPRANGPVQVNFDDPAETSRDQVITFAAGGLTNEDTPEVKEAILGYANSWFVNKDILMPDVRLHLFKCARAEAPLWIKLTGYPLMVIHILYNAIFDRTGEPNQMIAMASSYGKNWMKFMLLTNSRTEQALTEYWSGYPWRDQHEIKQGLWAYIKALVL